MIVDQRNSGEYKIHSPEAIKEEKTVDNLDFHEFDAEHGFEFDFPQIREKTPPEIGHLVNGIDDFIQTMEQMPLGFNQFSIESQQYDLDKEVNLSEIDFPMPDFQSVDNLNKRNIYGHQEENHFNHVDDFVKSAPSSKVSSFSPRPSVSQNNYMNVWQTSMSQISLACSMIAITFAGVAIYLYLGS